MQRIEQAQQVASQFRPDKGGLQDLIRQYNIGQDRLQQAIRALNNPMVSGMLNSVQPGLTDKLRAVASEVSTTQGNTQAASPNAQSGPQTDSVAALRDRLAKLK